MTRTIKDATGEVNTPKFHIEYRENEDGSLDVFAFRRVGDSYALPYGFLLGYSSLHYDGKVEK